jgi:hypothetical protein
MLQRCPQAFTRRFLEVLQRSVDTAGVHAGMPRRDLACAPPMRVVSFDPSALLLSQLGGGVLGHAVIVPHGERAARRRTLPLIGNPWLSLAVAG